MRVGALLRAIFALISAVLMLVVVPATVNALQSGSVGDAAFYATAGVAGAVMLLASFRLLPGTTR